MFTDQLVLKHEKLNGNNKQPLKKSFSKNHKQVVKTINELKKLKNL